MGDVWDLGAGRNIWTEDEEVIVNQTKLQYVVFYTSYFR